MTKLCEVGAGGTITQAAGDCTASGAGATTLALVWNALEHLATATRTGVGAVNESYTYDDSGRRIQKVSGATTTSYLYNGDDIHAEWSGAISGNPAAAYVHGASIDEPLLRLTGSTNSPSATQAAYMQDGLGSVIGTANTAGTLTANQRFDAWGVKTASSGTVPQYGYTGREPDATGLTFYRARYQHPGLGRFVSRDPMGMVDAVSGYAYVANNPTNLIDPLGLYAMPSSSFGSSGGAGGGKGPTLAIGNLTFLDYGAPTQQTVNAFGGNPFAGSLGQGTQVAAGPLVPLIIFGLGANEVATGDVPMIGGGAAKAGAKLADGVSDVAKKGGETAATIAGREAHKNYENTLGGGYEFNRALPSGKRPDAINMENNIVRELKPDNPSAIQRGLKQLQGYVDELEKITKQKWQGFLDTYNKR